MKNSAKLFIVIIFVVAVASGVLIYFSRSHKSSNETAKSEENGQVAGASTNSDSDNTDSNQANPDNAVDNGGSTDQSYLEKLAKFMTEKGMAMYGAYWCSHCQSQKELFGDAFQYVDYVECDPQGPSANPDECTAQGIEGYPTWIYQGQKYSGEQSLAKLAEIVGFSQ